MATLIITDPQFGADPALYDNRDQIQAALNAAQPGDIVQVPSWRFCVDPRKSLVPKSGTTLQIDGILQALPNAQRMTFVVLIQDVSDVTIILNGQIVGDDDGHANRTDDNGFGIGILNSSNVTVRGYGTINRCAGDGVYIDHGSKNIVLSQFTSSYNRRQGMSVVDVDGLNIDGLKLINTEGVPPSAGVDFEPDTPGPQSIRNVTMRNCVITGNKGASILIACPKNARSNIDIDGSNHLDKHPIDGSDGVVKWYAKWLFYIAKVYWLYPKSIKL